MNRQKQRLCGPDRVRIGSAHLEQVIAGVEARERHAMLGAKVNPMIRQAGHSVGQTVVVRRREVKRCKIKGNDVGPMIEFNAL